MIKWWALTDKKGRIFESTVRQSKNECWEHGYSMVAFEEGLAWSQKYWKRWDASIKSAKHLGYKFIRVEIRPIQNTTQR